MSAVKAVIDTSVMISVAFPKDGLSRELRDLLADEAFILVSSKEIMAELYRVLHYPRIRKQFNAGEDEINEFIGLLMEKALFTRGQIQLHEIKADPTDDMFLACALEAKADYIVSRDAHLRDLKQYKGIKIIDVKSFIGIVNRTIPT